MSVEIIPLRFPWGASFTGMTLFRGEKVFLIDTAFERSVPWLENELRELGLSLNDLDVVINTHTHQDHIEGNRLIAERSGAQFFIHPAGAAALEKHVPTRFHPLSDGEILDGGDFRCRIIFTPGHSDDSICILEETSKTLVIGDSIEGNGSGFCGIALIHDPEKYRNTLDKIESMHRAIEFQQIFFSHETDGFGDEVSGQMVREFLAASRCTLEKYIQATEMAIQENPELSVEECATMLRKQFGVTQNTIMPSAANGPARAFLAYAAQQIHRKK